MNDEAIFRRGFEAVAALIGQLYGPAASPEVKMFVDRFFADPAIKAAQEARLRQPEQPKDTSCTADELKLLTDLCIEADGGMRSDDCLYTRILLKIVAAGIPKQAFSPMSDECDE